MPAPSATSRLARAALLSALCVLLGACSRLPALPEALPAASPVPAAAPGTAWVLTVRSDGPRWLGPAWWAALGVPPEEVGPAMVALTQDGEPVPALWVAAPEGAGLLFYGETAPAAIDPVGSYLLTWGRPGLEMAHAATPDAGGAPCQAASWTTTHAEQDLIYQTTAPLAAPWLWTPLRPPEALTVTLPLTHAVAHPVTLTLAAWGQSSMPPDPDHHLRVVWDGTPADDHVWDGSGVERWALALPAPAGAEAALSVQAPGGTQAAIEVTWLDAFTVTWRRALVLTGGAWQRWAAETSAACWEVAPDVPRHDPDAASALLALLVGPGEAPRAVTPAGAPGADRVVVAQRAGDTGWIGVPWQAPPPDRVRPHAAVAPETLREVAYLAIVPEPFQAALRPLLDARAAEGLTVRALAPEAVYDTFGRGVPEPEAIQALVATLAREGRLRYLLLVGDATADPRAGWERAALSVPTAWTRTAFVGHTASDTALVAAASGVPQVALGRLPVATAEELEILVRKTLAWTPTSRLLVMHDDDRSFAELAADLQERQAPDLALSAGDPEAQARALSWLQAAPGTLVYAGHGSLPRLGNAEVLTLEDTGNWEGPTVVVAWSCLCADFTHPLVTGLAETWLRAPAGVAAFVGPTGETTITAQRAMALRMQAELAQGARLGDALAAAMASNELYDEARLSFLLLGDPALQVGPASTTE